MIPNRDFFLDVLFSFTHNSFPKVSVWFLLDLVTSFTSPLPPPLLLIKSPPSTFFYIPIISYFPQDNSAVLAIKHILFFFVFSEENDYPI